MNTAEHLQICISLNTDPLLKNHHYLYSKEVTMPNFDNQSENRKREKKKKNRHHSLSLLLSVVVSFSEREK